jgi:hypothetical protein
LQREKGPLIVPRGAERCKCLRTRYRMRAAREKQRKTQSHKTADLLLFPSPAGANGHPGRTGPSTLHANRCRAGKKGPGKPSQRCWIRPAPRGHIRGCSVTRQPPASTTSQDPAENPTHLPSRARSKTSSHAQLVSRTGPSYADDGLVGARRWGDRDDFRALLKILLSNRRWNQGPREGT